LEKIFKEAIKLIDEGEDFSLATIITRDGSAPRGPGAKMIVRNDGSIIGTIGGGLLEAVVIKKAAEVYNEKKARVEEFHLTGDDFSTIDMTCGGDLKVLIDFINATDPVNKEVFNYLKDGYGKNKPAYLVTLIPKKDPEFTLQKLSIIFEDGTCTGNNNFDLNDLLPVLSSVSKYKIVRIEDNKKLIVESLKTVFSAVIFGAGHVGLKVAELLKFTGFNITVIDDRPEFANSERFPFADKIDVFNSFDDNIDFLNIDKNTYIVIVTRGHINDEKVLALALKTSAGYIGMIGSRKKRDVIYRNLIAKGFADKDLERVFAPIGINIGADTPEEIAVSIVAEIIKVRSGLLHSNQ